MIDLDKDVKYIKGVGPTRVLLLNKLGIFTLKDLITYYPRTYEDRSKPKYICECKDGEEVLIEVVACSGMTNVRLNGKTMQRLMVRDETGLATITWFNQTYLKNKFKIGEKYKFFGKVNIKSGKVMLNSPVFDIEENNKNTGRIIPIYPLTYNLSQNTLRKIMESAIEEVYGKLEETLPQYLLKEYNLENLNEATKHIHFPDEFKDFNIARNRLVFEELLSVQLALLELKNNYITEEKGIQFDKNVKMSDVINMLPFKLTKAQLRVLEEIDNDMESNNAMNRLLQGDVGSGKTVVAMCAAYKAVKSGYQATIMAPTAILATQHLESFKNILKDLNITCELLISGITKNKKSEILEKLKNPKVLAGVVAGVVLIIGIICYFLLFGGNKQPNVMPNLVGLKQSEAEKILKDYDVTINKTVFKELSDDYKKGLITKTDPEKGSSIKEGDVITITVSKGKYIVLDNYTGLSYDEAKKKLNKIGFKVDIKREVSDKKAGTVLEQSLEKGYKQDPTDKDRTITLTISKGSYVILDDYTGMSYDDAYNKLSGLGFNVTKREQTSDQPAGTVIDQNLAKGYKVDPTDTNRNITLTVSTGYSQTVPSVVGLTPDSAKSNLENLGFTVSMEGTQFPESGGDERYIGAVYKQSIVAGTKVDKKGTTITIYYYED